MNKIMMYFLGVVVAIPLILVTFFYVLSSPAKETLTEAERVGPHPVLPKPQTRFLPIIKVAKAIGWSKDETPVPASGLKVNAFARGLVHPRWVYILPNGDVLVAESNTPKNSRNDQPLSLYAEIEKIVEGHLRREAGADTPSPNKIILLRDTTGNGIADQQSVFLNHLNSPFGMALVGHYFYVADADAIVRYPYKTGETSIKAAGKKIVDLMGTTTLNHHWTKSLLASPGGRYLYVGVGSNSNIGENGMQQEEGRAAIWRVDRKTGKHLIYASGLRNPVGLAWNPVTGALWTVVNERDRLGNDLVPDYLTSVKQGEFYGWPYSYYGQHADARVKPQRPDLVAKAISPDYSLGSHMAPLGLTFYTGTHLPKKYFNGAFIGEHGSWNRNPTVGYKVVFVKFVNGKPVGLPQDILTGFLTANGDAHGRPVGVTVDKSGALLVADDVGDVIWRVSAAR